MELIKNKHNLTADYFNCCKNILRSYCGLDLPPAIALKRLFSTIFAFAFGFIVKHNLWPWNIEVVVIIVCTNGGLGDLEAIKQRNGSWPTLFFSRPMSARFVKLSVKSVLYVCGIWWKRPSQNFITPNIAINLWKLTKFNKVYYFLFLYDIIKSVMNYTSVVLFHLK